MILLKPRTLPVWTQRHKCKKCGAILLVEEKDVHQFTSGTIFYCSECKAPNKMKNNKEVFG